MSAPAPADGPTDPGAVVRAFWERMQARDWAGARELLADDASFWWPTTRERFVGADDYVAMNAAYPEGWTIEVQTVRAEGDDVVALVRVPHPDGVSWCTEWSSVRDGRIVAATDWWTDEGSAPAPDWRAPFRTPTDPTPPASNEEHT